MVYLISYLSDKQEFELGFCPLAHRPLAHRRGNRSWLAASSSLA
jgi:hypothetical protein